MIVATQEEIGVTRVESLTVKFGCPGFLTKKKKIARHKRKMDLVFAKDGSLMLYIQADSYLRLGVPTGFLRSERRFHTLPACLIGPRSKSLMFVEATTSGEAEIGELVEDVEAHAPRTSSSHHPLFPVGELYKSTQRRVCYSRIDLC